MVLDYNHVFKLPGEETYGKGSCNANCTRLFFYSEREILYPDLKDIVCKLDGFPIPYHSLSCAPVHLFPRIPKR